jgi:hypothetical protein
MLDVGEAATTPPGKEIGPPGKGRKGRASYLGRDRDRPLKVTVTLAEKVLIDARAKEAGLSVASYLRACALGRQVHSVLDLRAVNDLVKVAGDQGRLGGLLKLWLVDQPGRGVPESDVRRLLDRIGEAQAALAEIVGRV